MPDQDQYDREGTFEIIAQITSAVHDKNPPLSLAHIHSSISNSGSANLLDPLNGLPILLLSQDQAARDLISLIGECGNPKEVLIAVQEAVERLESTLLSETVEDNDREEFQTPSAQLTSLLLLYSSSIPRLKAGKKSPYEILQPLLSQLESVIQLAAVQSQRGDGREIINSVSRLVQSVYGWANGITESSGGLIQNCKDVLRQLIDSTLAANDFDIRSSIAQRSFERCFPRLTIRSVVEAEWEEGERVVCQVKDAFHALGLAPDDIPSKPTISSLILLAHSPDILPPSQLLPLLPILLTSIQTNMALDESLSLLLTSLHRAQSQSPKEDLSLDIIIPLFSVLPSLASAHPEPATRHLTFRILSLLLSLTPFAPRLQLLRDIISNSEFPQMCVAAIALAKEAVLEALSCTTPHQNGFASSHFLQVLGPVLFRPRPLDLFSDSLTAEAFQKSLEPSRLVECLSLYYILLLRDKHNRTGVRDQDTISNVEKSLLGPLRVTLARWMMEDHIDQSHIEMIMPLASLQISLERVDSAISALVVHNK